jgi:ABC-type sugar transport system ATPase subunit
MVTASISLRDVGRTFGATRALADVDLDLKPGVTGGSRSPRRADQPGLA